MATKKRLSTSDKVSDFFQKNESFLSTLLGILVVVVIGVLVINYFRSSRTPKISDEGISEEIAMPSTTEGTPVVYEQNEQGQEVPKSLPQEYQVQTDESLWSIAQKKYGSGYNWVDIASANNLTSPDLLAVGQKLNLPKVAVKKPAIDVSQQPTITGSSYKVQENDSLWNISLMAYSDGYRWPQIAQANDLANPDLLEVGQALKLPRP
jgi:nucleoid-associated protein YgaU